jgi:hypothetical protein
MFETTVSRVGRSLADCLTAAVAGPGLRRLRRPLARYATLSVEQSDAPPVPNTATALDLAAVLNRLA